MLLALVILLNIVATFAYYSDKKDYSDSLNFGDIKINANNEIGANSYFASSISENLKPGDYLLNDDVKFSLDSTSEPAYIRAKYTASVKESKNLFNAKTFVDNAVSLGYSNISINNNYSNAINVPQVSYAEDHSKLSFACESKTPYTFSCKIDPTGLQNNASCDFRFYYSDGTSEGCAVNKSSTSCLFTTNASKTLSEISLGNWAYSGSFVAYEIQLEKGSVATNFVSCNIVDADYEVANYLKYKDMTLGNNLLSLGGRTVLTKEDNGSNTAVRNITGNQIFVGFTMNNYWYPFNIVSYSLSGNSITVASKNGGYGIGIDFLCSPNTSYTFSATRSASGCEVAVGFYKEDGTFIKYSNAVSGSLTFTTPSECTKLIIVLRPTADSTERTYANIRLTKDSILDFNSYNGTLSGSYYTQTGTSTKLEVGKTYKLTFDYALSDVVGTLGCGIGCGTKNSYNTDIIYQQNYTSTSGTFTASFTFTESHRSPNGNGPYEYIAFRFIRSGSNTDTGTISITNLKLEVVGDNAYYWSEKIGDYYYLMDASTNQPLIVNDSSKTYTFISKANSQIAPNVTYSSDFSGNVIGIHIGIEAIQVANLSASNTTKTTLENIKEKLDAINNVQSTGTYNVQFIVSGTTYSSSGISYGGDATIPDAVMTAVNETTFTGFAFSPNGYPVITKTGNCHSSLDAANKKLTNITENLVLYATTAVSAQKYTVTFVSESTILQTGEIVGNTCAYLGEKPTKAPTEQKEYIFSGWKIDGNSTIYTDLSEVTISKNTTFVAQFSEQTRTYSINYVLNEGSFKNNFTLKTSYVYGETFALPTAENMFKDGYTFAGWFETSDFSTSAVTQISSTTSGNKTYYAKWVTQ